VAATAGQYSDSSIHNLVETEVKKIAIAFELSLMISALEKGVSLTNQEILQ